MRRQEGNKMKKKGRKQGMNEHSKEIDDSKKDSWMERRKGRNQLKDSRKEGNEPLFPSFLVFSVSPEVRLASCLDLSVSSLHTWIKC